MNEPPINTVLITGANAGIGKEVARQLALNPAIAKIYLACRNQAKAQAAQAELEQATRRQIFQTVLMDVADVSSVRSALAAITEPVDALIMNAGGTGGKTPLALTHDGVSTIFATNVLGHVALLDGLVEAGKLNQIAIFVGSEAARGVPRVGIKRPALPTSSVDDFAQVCTGENWTSKNADVMSAYGEAKYVGALWISAAARAFPNLKLLTVSPGGTQGTEFTSSMPAPIRFLVGKIVIPFIAPLLGFAHSLQIGSRRIVDALTDPTLKTGGFYASKANTLTGPIIDQTGIFPDLANQSFQNNAAEAIHRFL